MSQTLPDGLIKSHIHFDPDDKDLQTVPVADLIRLWRVYHSAKRGLENATGTRLAQFFWRIIGSTRLQQSLTGAQIAYLHTTISQDIPIHTTPRPSPLHGRAEESEQASSGSDTCVIGKASVESPDEYLTIHRGNRATVSGMPNQIGRERSTSRPRPILRIPGVDATTPGKSARILTPTWGQNAKGKQPARGESSGNRGSLLKAQFQDLSNRAAKDSQLKSSTPVSTSQQSEDSPTSQSASGSSRSSKKGPSFPVSSKKRKPSMPRRTSSQSTSSANGKSPKPMLSPLTRITTSTKSQSYKQDNSQDARDLKPIEENKNASKSFPSGTRPKSASQSEVDSGLKQLANIGSLLNPQMRNLSTKSALATGLTLNSPITASLQPFADEEPTSSIGGRVLSGEQNTSASQRGEPDVDILPRSRSNLSLLLQKDKRRGR